VSSKETNAVTKREWRELGFFYERDDQAKRWRIVGSASGVTKFCRLLRQYVADPRNAKLSEHRHYGPYMYLKVMTWTAPQLDNHVIAGRLEDLARMADLVESKIASTPVGAVFTIGREYAPTSVYYLEVQLMESGFDPSAADPNCQDPPEA
jgi:hypothetical protein